MRLIVVGLALALLPSPAPADPAPATGMKYPEFAAREHKEAAGALPYRLLSPAELKPGVAYPLVIWLHGSGEVGNDNRAQLASKVAETFLAPDARKNFPCFVMVPQASKDSGWLGVGINKPPDISDSSRRVVATVAELVKEFGIDSQRIYIGGFSMGGIGTWDLLVRYPDLFAAAFPIAGPPMGRERLLPLVKDVPVWLFQGDKDGNVPVASARSAAAAFKAAGGRIQYTEYAGLGHDCSRALSEPKLLEWLFSCRRAAAASFTPATLPADGFDFVKTLPPGTHGTWSGKVEHTAHAAARLPVDGVRYRLQPAKDAKAGVAETLVKIGKGELAGEYRVTGTVVVDRYAWITVEEIEPVAPAAK